MTTSILKPELDTFLASLGGSEGERQAILGYLLNTLSSANGQVTGIENTILNLQTQLDAAKANAQRVADMVAKFTTSSPAAPDAGA